VKRDTLNSALLSMGASSIVVAELLPQFREKLNIVIKFSLGDTFFKTSE
jgi:hypothetical protein